MTAEITLPGMTLDEARSIGRLCADLDPGYPPTNVIVLVRAALSLRGSGEPDDQPLVAAIFRQASIVA